MALVQQKRRENTGKIWAWILPLSVFVAGAGTWQYFTTGTQSLLIPTFIETVEASYNLLMVEGQIWEPLYQSNKALVLGYAISVGLGIPVGLLMARVRWFETITEPYTHLFLAMPTAPLIPLIMMALGLGLASRVFVVVIFSLIYITINTRAGVRNVEASLIEMAKSLAQMRYKSGGKS